MSDVSIRADRPDTAPLEQAASAVATVGDYIALLKPRVMSLVVLTALAGLAAAPHSLHPVLSFAAILCIAVGAGAAGALNMWYDADIDARMARTASRPIPRGRVAPSEALGFGVFLAAASVTCLGILVNWVAAGLLAVTIGFYLFVYTMRLKRRTPQNIVIGGAAGAFPPMIGWAAVTGSVSVESIALFLVIFMWTPPHFWALSLYRMRDYARAGVPMLPVVSGVDETKRQILIYSLILAPIGLLPLAVGTAGLLSGALALALGVIFVWLAWRLYRTQTTEDCERCARQLFGFSILYLLVLFAAILAEHGLGVGRFL